MSCRTLKLCSSLLCCLALVSCRSHGTSPGVRRVALLRFENLSLDPSLDWLARGIPGTLGVQLRGSKTLDPVPAESGRDARLLGAELEVAGYYATVRGRLEIVAHVRDTASNRTVQTFSVSGDPAREPISLIDGIAHQLSPDPWPFPTRNPGSARAFWQSFDAASAEQSAASLAESLRQDPAFSSARFVAIEHALAYNDSTAAMAQVNEAKALAGSFSEYDRARLGMFDALVRGDTNARAQALRNMSRLSPSDGRLWQNLGDLEFGRRNYKAAVESLEEARRTVPEDTAVVNTMGYAKALSGDLAGATAILEEYRRRAPADANAVDSLGDFHFIAGRFADAEKLYLEAHRMNPLLLAGGDQFRAALSRYFAGDRAGADALFAGYLQYMAANGDVVMPIREAVWEASTGRMANARLRLQNFQQRSNVNPALRPFAAIQLALFEASEGRPYSLEQFRTPMPTTGNLHYAAWFLAQPDASAAEWTKRAGPLLQNPSSAPFGKQLVGYALLFHGRYGEALPVWQQKLEEVRPEVDADARVMLAWAASASGKPTEASRLLALYPIPPRTLQPGLSFLTIAKMRELKK